MMGKMRCFFEYVCLFLPGGRHFASRGAGAAGCAASPWGCTGVLSTGIGAPFGDGR